MEEKRCAVVTGGNKGIGFEIFRQLALNNIQVILTAGNESRGIEAVNKLNDCGLPIPNVIFHQLDIQDSTSMPYLVQFIKTRFTKLDILALLERLVDENGEFLPGVSEQTCEMVEECLKTDYYGTKRVTEALVPLLQLSKSSRIVNITSNFGLLFHIPNEKSKEELDDIDNLTEERIDEIIQLFLRESKTNKFRENGWPLAPSSAYIVSKVVMNAYTRLIAKKSFKTGFL
ncbi:putative (+)-neomenthol dehydrogenase [Helianthus annuus]|nr:putative (+)-neomenthol dehydrogenase [Helianthus annuus]KAJ0445338.1 putative (+)-neomenthol dehydrogenase [Helianthus annuus]KAJ0462438.1 putative (+)-neomenthol dehydrogenase [Helianthus annuus]KAJ0838166.1 putative (+)-neomenthol dehydrogenase [Helianthus annuus]